MGTQIANVENFYFENFHGSCSTVLCSSVYVLRTVTKISTFQNIQIEIKKKQCLRIFDHNKIKWSNIVLWHTQYYRLATLDKLH